MLGVARGLLVTWRELLEVIPAWNNLEFICHEVTSQVYLAASSLLSNKEMLQGEAKK